MNGAGTSKSSKGGGSKQRRGRQAKPRGRGANAKKRAAKDAKKPTRKRKKIDPMDESQWGEPPHKYDYDFEVIKNNIYPEGIRKPKPSSEQCGCEYKEGVIGCTDESCLNRMMFLECNPKLCAFGKSCGNARLQRRQFSAVKPVWRGPKGWGLFTMKDLKKGHLILEYCGDVISKEGKERRLREGKKTKKFYLMSLNALETIDGTERGNLSRFINHSCDPNSQTQKWRVDGRERIGLFAFKDLPKMTELSYDYFGGNFSENHRQFFGSVKQVCYCGSDNCGGYLGVRPKALDKCDANKDKKEDAKRRKKKKAAKNRGDADDDRLGRYVAGLFELKGKKTDPEKNRELGAEANPPYLERNLVQARALRVRWLSKICQEDEIVDLLRQVASAPGIERDGNSSDSEAEGESNSS